MSVIKSRLRIVLAERRMTFKQLHQLTGIREHTIGDYANDMVDRVNLRHLEKICDVLKCTMADLFDFHPDDPFK